MKIDYELCCWKDGRCTSGSSDKSSCCSADSGACEGCAEICPTGAITRNNTVHVDIELCTDCGVCVDACPHGALTLE